ncbi:hypothetical protein DE146DRAFT_661172 [Phaeosphaeria sp. MPI-PUGE-AT-0046c]|nr:hypothetical protein DE146DRAFT_661172 [Phaeosphaeria sp. MPI-PUGE-AT-0046c]
MSDERRLIKHIRSPLYSPGIIVRLAGANRAPNLTSRIIKIVVGNGTHRRIFRMPEVLLTHRSGFFASRLRYLDNATQEGGLEAVESPVDLSNVLPEIFALYEKYIYFDIIAVFYEEPQRWKTETVPYTRVICNKPELCFKEYELLVSLYLLGDYLQDTDAKVAVVESIVTKVTHECAMMRNSEPCLPPASAIRAMWEGTPHHCSGRQVLLDCFVYHGGPTSEALGLRDVPTAFSTALNKRMMALRQPPATKMLYANTWRDIEASNKYDVREVQITKVDSSMEAPRDTTIAVVTKDTAERAKTPDTAAAPNIVDKTDLTNDVEAAKTKAAMEAKKEQEMMEEQERVKERERMMEQDRMKEQERIGTFGVKIFEGIACNTLTC